MEERKKQVQLKKHLLYEFGINGPTSVKLQSWMNKKNCPNAFSDEYLKGIADFIKKHLAVLLLTWFLHLDEADLLHYFEGTLSWSALLNSIDTLNKDKILDCKSEEELYKVCKDLNLYQF